MEFRENPRGFPGPLKSPWVFAEFHFGGIPRKPAARGSAPRCGRRFAVDFVSVLPFWAISLNWDDPFGTAVPETTALLRGTMTLRMVKLLRMLKLARVLKASRVLKRQLVDIAMGQLEFTFAVLKMIKLITMLILFSHWQACLWGLLSSYMSEPTWMSEFEATFEERHGTPPSLQ